MVIGISTDTLELQQKFTDKENLNFPLYADVGGKVGMAFGAVAAGKGTAARQSFVIDKKGIIRKIYPKVDPKSHPDEVLKFVKENLK